MLLTSLGCLPNGHVYGGSLISKLKLNLFWFAVYSSVMIATVRWIHYLIYICYFSILFSLSCSVCATHRQNSFHMYINNMFSCEYPLRHVCIDQYVAKRLIYIYEMCLLS